MCNTLKNVRKHQKEARGMDIANFMDIIMIGTLVISFVLLKLLADFCARQTDKEE